MDQILETLLGAVGGGATYGQPTQLLQQHQAPVSSSSSGERSSELDFIEERLDRLTLVCMAMWSLMQDKTSLTEEDLLERVRLLDLMDGAEDGRAQRTVQRCGKCDRPMSTRHQRCLYCGHEKLIRSAFDRV